MYLQMAADLLLARESVISVALTVSPIAFIVRLATSNVFRGEMRREVVRIAKRKTAVFPSTDSVLLFLIRRGHGLSLGNGRQWRRHLR